MDISTPAWTSDRIGWLLLSWFDGFGSRTFEKLLRRYGREGDSASRAPREALEGMGHGAETVDRFFAFRDSFDTARAIALMEQDEIRFVFIEDESYPQLLKQIADPPIALFVRGAFPIPSSLPVAIVGTRACSPYGRAVAGSLSRDLAIAGCTIVSGLALGIDAITHEAVLDVGGTCIAVLGTGCDEQALYPRANVNLAHRMLDHGGTILSEFPPGTTSQKHHFPLRNRIISGLSLATLVIEAAEDSGSLITASQALQQNRDVLAVPGPITNRQSSGTNQLIKQGAIPCTSAADVLDTIRTPGATPMAQLSFDVTSTEKDLLSIMEYPRHIDDLSRELRSTSSALSALITALELKGLVEPHGANSYARTKLWKPSVD